MPFDYRSGLTFSTAGHESKTFAKTVTQPDQLVFRMDGYLYLHQVPHQVKSFVALAHLMYARQCSYLHEAAQPLRNVHSNFLSGLGRDPFAELFYKLDDAILHYWLKFLESSCCEAMIPQFPADSMLF